MGAGAGRKNGTPPPTWLVLCAPVVVQVATYLLCDNIVAHSCKLALFPLGIDLQKLLTNLGAFKMEPVHSGHYFRLIIVITAGLSCANPVQKDLQPLVSSGQKYRSDAL